MKKHISLFLLMLAIYPLRGLAQESEILTLNTGQAEALFLKQNLSLIAQQLNVNIADAMIVQAKLWPNPAISIQQINLWSTDKQRGGVDEIIPPLFGSVGKNQQFSIELTQMIQTAGKRRKLVQSEQVSKEIAVQEFEQLLRSLKFELNDALLNMLYLQTYQQVLQKQANALKQLVDAHKKQAEQGNVSKNEYLRLKASLVELMAEVVGVETETNQQKNVLKTLLALAPTVDLVISDSPQAMIDPNKLVLDQLMTMAIDARPEVKQAHLQTDYFNKSLLYEKAQRVPNLNIHANYDRAGGIWNNYWGLGVSFDLPFFHRNQGNIQRAGIQIAQSKHQAQLQTNIVQHEVVTAFRKYSQSYAFYKDLVDDDFSTDLDAMFNVYAKNLVDKNISLIEFIDFSGAYKNNQQIILMAHKTARLYLKELEYCVGRIINN